MALRRLHGGSRSGACRRELARRHGWAAALARAALAFAGRPLRFAAVVWDPQTIALLEEALRALGDGATALHARVMARLAEELTFAGQRTRCETLARQAIDAARQLGDPSVISAVLHSLYWALWSPDRALERLALAQEMVPLADAGGDRTTAFAAHLLRGLARLELCNVVAARQELGACAQQASALRQPYADWLVACTRVCLSFAEGRLDEVEALLAHCLAVGEATESPNVVLFHAVQRAHLYWLRGCGDETQALLDALGRTHSAAAPAVRCVAALTFAEQGRLAEARAALASAASDHFRAARRNATWLMSIALLAEACAVLGDRERATALYELLRPFAGRSVVLAPALHFGVADHFLGVLAATVGRWDHAARHFQEALILNARMGTRQWLARTEIAYAELLAAHCGPERAEEARRLADEALASAERLRLAPVARRARALLDTLPASRTTAASHGAGPPGSIDHPTSTLHRAGDFWILTHRGTTCHLKHSKAVATSLSSLPQPMRELHVLDLVAIANGNGSATIVQNGLGPALDARARVDLRATRIDLSAQLEEAEQWNDEGRSRDLRAKLQTLEEYVLANYGLGGRARNGKASAEQARQAVAKGITATRRRIAQHHPALAVTSRSYVRTCGYPCSYKPPPEDPITWVVGGA